jgi:hypothetical protein
MALSTKERSARYRATHREARIASTRAWQKAHPDRQRASKLAWLAKRPDYFIELRKNPEFLAREKVNGDRWQNANREKVRATVNAWAKRNPGVMHAKAMKRYASKLRAVPAWLSADDHAQMKAIYADSAQLTRTTGVRYNVDHIVPLQSDRVCGLHVPWNLQILTKLENLSKSNFLDKTISGLPSLF